MERDGVDRRSFLRLAVIGGGGVVLLAASRARSLATGRALPDGVVSGLAFARGLGVAVGRDGQGQAAIWWRDGAAPWARSQTALPSGAALHDVSDGPGGFAAVGAIDRTPAVWTSTHGARWSRPTTLPADGVLAAVAAAGESVLAAGAYLDEESDEPASPLVAASGTGGWRLLEPPGGAPAATSLSAAANVAGRWVVAGTSTAGSAAWASGRDGWEATDLAGTEPIAWSTLLPLDHEVVAVGSTVAGGRTVLSRSSDALHWSLSPVGSALAALGDHVEVMAVDPQSTTLGAAGPGLSLRELSGTVLG